MQKAKKCADIGLTTQNLGLQLTCSGNAQTVLQGTWDLALIHERHPPCFRENDKRCENNFGQGDVFVCSAESEVC